MKTFVVLALLSVLVAAPKMVTIPFSGAYKIGNIPASQGCKGRLVIDLQRGKKRLARKTTPLRATCQYRVTFRVKASAVGTATKLTVIVRFKGNKRLGPTTNRFNVTVPGPLKSEPKLPAATPVPQAAPVPGPTPTPGPAST